MNGARSTRAISISVAIVRSNHDHNRASKLRPPEAPLALLSTPGPVHPADRGGVATAAPRVAVKFPMRQNGVVWKDLLYGVRALRRSPVFTTAAVLSLAVGIGANTAIFSLLYQVVLRSLPIAQPERLVAVHGSYSGPGESSSSWSTNSESVFPYPFY